MRAFKTARQNNVFRIPKSRRRNFPSAAFACFDLLFLIERIARADTGILIDRGTVRETPLYGKDYKRINESLPVKKLPNPCQSTADSFTSTNELYSFALKCFIEELLSKEMSVIFIYRETSPSFVPVNCIRMPVCESTIIVKLSILCFSAMYEDGTPSIFTHFLPK